jgi:hypothetical protein
MMLDPAYVEFQSVICADEDAYIAVDQLSLNDVILALFFLLLPGAVVGTILWWLMRAIHG